jgi:RNA polymerase sigma-70 factor (ECF subfamily)
VIDDHDADRRDARAYLAGSEGGFDTLYSRHTPRVYGLALRLTGGNAADAGDVVQETWLRALSRLDSFRWGSRLSTWLCGICVNVWRERVRRVEPLLRIDGAPEPVDLKTVKASAHEPIDVERALARLAPGYRAVLVLHAIYGYPHADIASLLGITESTSKSQLARARTVLKAAVDDDGRREETA